MKNKGMMTSALIMQLVDLLKDQGKEAFFAVQEYGGEFDDEEIDHKSFSCPAAFPTILGWKRQTDSSRLGGKNVWLARIAVFIACKHPQREVRFQQAMQRAELVSALLDSWRPIGCFGDVKHSSAENLYSRKVDKKGLSLWMVSGWQEVLFDPGTRPPVADLPDLVAVNITSQAGPTVPLPTPPDLPDLEVTDLLEMRDAES